MISEKIFWGKLSLLNYFLFLDHHLGMLVFKLSEKYEEVLSYSLNFGSVFFWCN